MWLAGTEPTISVSSCFSKLTRAPDPNLIFFLSVTVAITGILTADSPHARHRALCLPRVFLLSPCNNATRRWSLICVLQTGSLWLRDLAKVTQFVSWVVNRGVFFCTFSWNHCPETPSAVLLGIGKLWFLSPRWVLCWGHHQQEPIPSAVI